MEKIKIASNTCLHETKCMTLSCISFVVGCILICIFASQSDVSLIHRQVAVLIVVAGVCLVPINADNFVILQKILMFYLIGHQISCANDDFTFKYLDNIIYIANSLPVMLFLIISWLFSRRAVFGNGNNEEMNPTKIWVWSLSIIIAHMVAAKYIVTAFYGFGNDKNLLVLGNITLYIFLFMIIWNQLDMKLLRQIIAVILIIHFGIAIFC